MVLLLGIESIAIRILQTAKSVHVNDRTFRLRWEVDIRMDVRKTEGLGWNGCIWFRIGTSGGLL
jgi:hypothetical protein